MPKLFQKSRSDIQNLTSDSKLAFIIFFLALGVLVWILGFGEAKQLQSSLIFDTAAQNQLKPYVETAKSSISDYRKAIGQGNGGAYDNAQEAANCTTHLAAQLDAAKELRGDYQQFDAAIGYADYIQNQRNEARAKTELTNATIGNAFDINSEYWVNLKNEELAARNKLEATNNAVGDCLNLYNNDTSKCIQQKADWDKAQTDYTNVVLKIKNAVKEKELETIKKIDSNTKQTSFIKQPNLLKATLLDTLLGNDVSPNSTSSATTTVTTTTNPITGATSTTTTTVAPTTTTQNTGILDSLFGSNTNSATTVSPLTTTTQPNTATSLVSSAATSFLGGLLGNGGSINLGGTNWNVGFSWPSSNGSTAVITGPGTTQGLNTFKNNYRGNTYTSAIGMITGWTNFALPFVSVIAITALIYAGFLYLTAFGNEEQTGKAKKIILWVVVGIIIIISAYAIVNTLVSEGSNGGGSSSTSVNVSVGNSSVSVTP